MEAHRLGFWEQIKLQTLAHPFKGRLNDTYIEYAFLINHLFIVVPLYSRISKSRQ